MSWKVEEKVKKLTEGNGNNYLRKHLLVFYVAVTRPSQISSYVHAILPFHGLEVWQVTYTPKLSSSIQRIHATINI